MKHTFIQIEQIFNDIIKAEKNKTMIENGFLMIKNFDSILERLLVDDISHIAKIITKNKDIANDIQSSLLMTMVSSLEDCQNKLITKRGYVVELNENSMLSKLNELSETEKQLHSSRKSLKKITNKILETHDNSVFLEQQILGQLENAEDMIDFVQELLNEIEKKTNIDDFGGTKEESKKLIETIVSRISNVSRKVKDIDLYADKVADSIIEQPFEKLNIKEQKEKELFALENIYEEQLKPIQEQVDAYNQNGIIIGSIKEEKLTNEECVTLYKALKKAGYHVHRFEETVKKNRKQDVKTTNLADLPIAGESLKNKHGIFIIAVNDDLRTKKINSEYFAARTFQGDDVIQRLVKKGIHIQKNCSLSIHNKKVLHTYDVSIKSNK